MSKQAPKRIRVKGQVYVQVNASKASRLFDKYTDYILEHAREVAQGKEPPPVEKEEQLWKALADEVGEWEADGWFDEWARGLSDPDDKYAVYDYPFPAAPAPKAPKGATKVNGRVHVRADVADKLTPKLGNIANMVYYEIRSDSREVQRKMVQKFFGRFLRTLQDVFPDQQARQEELAKAGYDDPGELALDVINDMIAKAFSVGLQVE